MMKKASYCTQKRQIKRAFSLVEVLIAIMLVSTVSISVFSVESMLERKLRLASAKADAEAYVNKALSLLIEKLVLNQIPLDVIENEKEASYPLEGSNWRADYTFEVKNKEPKDGPKVFLIVAIVKAVNEKIAEVSSQQTFYFAVRKGEGK